ncbi:hypothetical protein [Lonepinella sp. BR2357]|uniref:hypothetical protein n=1 Tax=Lonepinella sp. BR2357 TaxID=3434549 RepID=UPI003F6E164C
MLSISQNPYRIIGVVANVSEKELLKQKNKIKAFARTGKIPDFELDFPPLPTISRTTESIDHAFSQIELAEDKVFQALFWLVNLNAFDNVIIEKLKSQDSELIQDALGTLENLCNHTQINQNNFSRYNNASTVLLLQGIEVASAVRLKYELLNSSYFDDFILAIADKTVLPQKQKLIERFTDKLISEFQKNHEPYRIISFFKKSPEEIQRKVKNLLTADKVHKIEHAIEICEQKRKNNPSEANNFAYTLIELRNDVANLARIFGKKDVAFNMLSDNFADEIRSCAVSYFNEQDEPELYVYEECLELFSLARDFAKNPQTIQRLDNEISQFEESVKNYHQNKKVNNTVPRIIEKTEQLKNKPYINIIDVDKYLDDTLPLLRELKGTETHALMVNIVASVAMGKTIVLVNRSNSNVRQATQIFNALNTQTDYMDYELRAHFRKNYEELKKMNAGRNSVSYSNSSSDSGDIEMDAICLIVKIIIGAIILINLFSH